MNETEFLREQVRTERRHMAEVRSALDSALTLQAAAMQTGPAPGPAPGTAAVSVTGSAAASMSHSNSAEFCGAAARYLVFIVQRFNAQDSIHCEQLRPRISAADHPARQALEDLTQTLQRSALAIATLQAALQASLAAPSGASDTLRVACTRYLEFYRTELATRQNSLYPLLEQHYGAADWRRASLVDADSILEERALYAAVRALLPPGVELKSRGRPAPFADDRPTRAEVAP